MIVEARVTGHNSGGLEVQVNRLRGFIPVSQIALYRVENLEEFVGQKWPCVVTDANPDRRRLVLSRRAMLEREKEESRQKLWATLEPGQIREGVVRKLMDFGAFIDLGGVDGLLHISQLSWARVKHPSEVLHEGQTIKVKISKIDPETRKLSLTYREMLENPWDAAAGKYSVNSVARGVVTKLMEFGAFVQLEPGIEGLVHISELSPKRVWRVSDVVQEGQEVDVLILSVDRDAERMSLSMKALAAKPEPEKDKKEAEAESIAAPPPAAARKKPNSPLKGGLGQGSGGERFGLRW
jgi:small subunit ribosomal protein S1